MSKRDLTHKWLLDAVSRGILIGPTANTQNLPRATHTEIGPPETVAVTIHQHPDGEIVEVIHDEFITKQRR